MTDWQARRGRTPGHGPLGERYRRYRLPDPVAEAAMAGSLRRYGQLTPLVVCRREETPRGARRLQPLAAARCWA